eukprot:10897898-Alexandrium_andersonii.AAC.1
MRGHSPERAWITLPADSRHAFIVLELCRGSPKPAAIPQTTELLARRRATQGASDPYGAP